MSRPADGRDAESAQVLRLNTARVGSAVVVAAFGEVDLLTAPRLADAVRDALAEPGPGPVVVDLSAVGLLASKGLGVLVTAMEDAAREREPLRVVVDYTRSVIRPLHITGLDRVLALYHTVEDALCNRPRPAAADDL